MAMTYEQTATLMKDAAFVGRVKVACLTFSNYILGEAPNTAGHSGRVRWAQSVATSSEGVAAQIAPIVTMDPKVQADGSAITDVNLQIAVESAVNKLL